MSTVIQKVKILLDEHQEPFIPFTTSESIFINGTDERLTDYLDNYYQAGDGIEIDPETHTISAVTECLGYASQFKTSANAIRIDLLEANKVYYILNDRGFPDANGLYFSIAKNDTILTTSISTWDNQKVNVYYLCKNKSYANPETQGTFYTNVYYRRLDGTTGNLSTYSYDIYELNGVLDKTFSGKNYAYLTTDQQQTITAKKTFDVLPVSSVVPTSNSQLVNKKYVDDNVLTKAYQLAGLNAYSTSATYAVDDYVYYNNLIYKCNTAITTAEAWDSTHWTQKTYIEYLQDTLTI